MQYRKLGKTGLRVSQLGFGAMRLPMSGEGEAARIDRERAIPLIHRAFAAGVNYIDSAVMYCNGDSQRAVGEALRAWQPAPGSERIVVSTKNHYSGENEAEWWRNLEDSLERLGVPAIDVYHHHGVNWKQWQEALAPRVSKWMLKARDQGLVRHVACSFHDTPEALLQLIDTGYPEVLTVQYNLLDRRLEEGIARAHAAGIGVVVMGPVAGGRLGEPSEVLATLMQGVARVPELALRFVLANEGVTVALSGMSEPAHVDENTRVAAERVALSEADTQAIHEHLTRLDKMAELYCTGCRYCLPCAHEVDIPGVFEKYNRGRVWGLWESARAAYAQMGNVEWDKGMRADACLECGECEEKCPQHIPIREQLAQAHAALTQSG